MSGPMFPAREKCGNAPPRRRSTSGRAGRLTLVLLSLAPSLCCLSFVSASSSVLDGKECVYPTWECSSPDPALSSTEYHLSPSGDDDAGDGLTTSTAWKTPSRALKEAGSRCGEVLVHLAAGHYGAGIDASPKDSKEYAAREANCGGPNASMGWVTFLGGEGGGSSGSDSTAVLSHALISSVPNARIVLRSIMIDGTRPGSSGDNNAVNVQSSSRVRLDDVVIDPSSADDLLWTTNSAMPQGVHTRDASDLVVTRSSVVGGRYGAVLRGTDLHLLNTTVGHQFADAVRIVSASRVTVENCLIHSVADYQNTGEHLDGIQFFAAGPAGSYPQVRDVILRNNVFRNMAGQMIFVQSNYVDQIGYIENVLIEGNVLEKKSVDDASIPIQLQRVKNFGLEGNTVDGDVLVRDDSEGWVRDNLIRRLRVTTGSVLTGSTVTDHNVLGEYLTDSTTAEVTPGSSSVVDPAAVVFADPDNGDYSPQTAEACTGASDGLHAGAVPCNICGSTDRWWEPSANDDVRSGYPDGVVALFSPRPSRVPLGESVELIASASVSCDGSGGSGSAGTSAPTRWIWSTSDGQSFETTTPYTSVLFSTPGTQEITLVVEDDAGLQSPPAVRTVVVEAPPEPGLLAYYPLSDAGLEDASPARHDAAVYKGSSVGGVSLVPFSPCPGSDAVALDGAADYLEFPPSVRDSVNNLPSLTVGIFARPLSPGGQLFYKHVTVGIRVDAARVYCNVGTSSNGWWPEIKALVPGAAHVDGGWHHYAVTYDSIGGTVGCYFDGELVGTKESLDGVRSGTWPLTAGVNKFKSNYMAGDVAEMKVYDRALDGEEIAQWAAGGGTTC